MTYLELLFIKISENNLSYIKKFILKHKSLVNAHDKNGSTALMVASFSGSDEVVALLIKANADVNAHDKNGFTALLEASFSGHDEVVELLIKSNADINIRNNNGYTALIGASINDHVKVVDLLIKANADINIRDNKGYTALMIASLNVHVKVVDLLIKANADINIRDNKGYTALEMVCHMNNKTSDKKKILIIKRFLDHGVDPKSILNINTNKQVEFLLKEYMKSEEEKSKEECSICLDDLYERENTTLLCGHVFHKDCLANALRAFHTGSLEQGSKNKEKKFPCPTCRKTISDGVSKRRSRKRKHSKSRCKRRSKSQFIRLRLRRHKSLRINGRN